MFLRQAAAGTAHDIVAFEDVLASAPPGRPDPIALVFLVYEIAVRTPEGWRIASIVPVAEKQTVSPSVRNGIGKLQ